jgi:multisubunit Na+/H+ antiporter MnhE subunit
MRHGVKHVLPRLAGWLALFWLWMLLAGDWNRTELTAAAAAATVASLFVRLPPRFRVSNAWNVPVMVFVDFAILMWALVRSALRREIVRGEFVRRPFRVDDAGARAWIGIAAGYSPNAYVVGFDIDGEVALLHDLVRNRSSERPV